MRYNKKILMIATTAMLGVGCMGLMGGNEVSECKDGGIRPKRVRCGR